MAHPDQSARVDALEREVAALKEVVGRRSPSGGLGGWRAKSRYLLVATAVLALTVTGVATGVTGDPIREGQRNPASGTATQETSLVASHDEFTGRFTNHGVDDGGSVVGTCDSTPANEACIRARNFNTGRAFEFFAVEGDEVGQIMASDPDARPFTTNAGGVATGLNADKLDGFDAEDLQGGGDPSTVGAHWGPIARNTIGSPVEEPRNGPFVSPPGAGDSPPHGVGSLGFEVADGTEKAAFGNEVDFLGDAVADLNETGFRVYTTGENMTDTSSSPGGSADNLPNITIEVDPTGFANTTAPNFSSLVFVPNASAVPSSRWNRWSDYIDATDGGNGGWYFTNGTTATATGCSLSSLCSFDDMKSNAAAAYPDMQITSMALAKGRDNAWQGAVDGFRVNDEIFDFELYGVRTEEVSSEAS
jgi:hypothetical protein